MLNQSTCSWTYSLPLAMLLMAPFDLLASLAMDVYLPVTPHMSAALKTSPSIIQLTLSLYMVTLGLGQMFFGPIADRIGRRTVVLSGSLLFTLSSFALAMTDNGLLFLVLRILQALGASAALVATFATVRDIYGDRPEGSSIYSLFSSMLAFVPALGPIIGAVLAVHYGWRAIFVMLGVIGFLAFAQALPLWHETRPQLQNEQRFPIRLILKSPSFWIYTLGFSTAMGVFFVFFSTAPRVLIERAGLSQVKFSFVFASVAGVMIITTRFAKQFVSRWGIEGSLIRGLSVILTGALILAGCSFASDPSIATFIIPMWVIAVGMIFVVSVTANGALREFPQVAGTAVALYYCIQSVIVAVVGTAMTFFLPGDSSWPLIAYAFILSAVTFLALVFGRSKHR